MHEVTEPPKKGSPNPWIVVVLSALSLCLLLITVTDGLEADKNEKALAASRTEAAQQRTLLQGKVDVLTAEHAAASRASAQRLATAEKRIAELTAELDRFKVAQPPREILFPKVDQAMSDVDRVARKPALLAHALEARNAGDLLLAKSKFEEMLALDPKDIGANEGLTSVNAALNAALAEASSFAPAGGNWDEINKRFLEKLGFEKSVTMTASGLRFKVISYGNGPKPNATSTVKCLYTGKLIDGRMFDSTKNRNNEPAEFPLNAVIPAWNEGIQYVGVGGKIILYAPPHLAYGAWRTGPIPPHSVLIFEIELVEITK
jgi:FKBP-type peptidyl-prolyl cis-trans isomerase